MKLRSNTKGLLLSISVLMLCAAGIKAQETVFTGLQSPMKRAERHFQNQQYIKALELYLQAADGNKPSAELPLKLAHTYSKLNKPQMVVDWYEKYLKQHKELSSTDLYTYAEAFRSLGKYDQAISLYQQYSKQYPDDEKVLEKIWSLKYISRLLEDSIYYSVKPAPFNTSYSELAPAYVDGGLVYVSNHKPRGGIVQLDPLTDQPYLSLHFSPLKTDSLSGEIQYGDVRTFLKSQSKLHQGPAAQLTSDSTKLIYTRSTTDSRGDLNIQLYWAHREGDKWVEGEALGLHQFIQNASYPALSGDGKTLFFVSDVEGGFGGKDLYKSEWQQGRWSAPENLGAEVNTNGDETTPFVHGSHTFYFASNGHGGLGGLDLFKAHLKQEKIMDIENLGYPINTSYDDFGLVLNSSGTKGFMASNRGKGGFNDDIYELEIDLQTYPLTISGELKIKESKWADPSNSAPLPHASMVLVDNYRKVAISQVESDRQGKFSLEIPYASQYQIRVIEPNIGYAIVSLEIPKNRKLHHDHQIVVVKSMFQTHTSSSDKSTMYDVEMVYPSTNQK